MDQEKIGKFISTLRKEKNFTQEDLATKLGITKNAVSKWERGLGLMDISLLKPLCEILDISIAELLNGERIEENDIRTKTNDVIHNTIDYARKKIKKNKCKDVLITSFVFFSLIVIFLLVYQIFLLNEYTLEKPENVDKVNQGFQNTIKIYKKTLSDNDYLSENNIKIRNDFEDYEREEYDNLMTDTKMVIYRNKELSSSVSISIIPQYIDIFSADAENISFFYSDENKKIEVRSVEDKFTSADRKYFLLKNDINNDIDFINYIHKNYYIKNNIFMNKRTMMENYAFNLIVSIAIPEVESTTLITGDYEGYIFNIGRVKEVHILRDGLSYTFLFSGAKLIQDDYLEDIISTIEIR